VDRRVDEMLCVATECGYWQVSIEGMVTMDGEEGFNDCRLLAVVDVYKKRHLLFTVNTLHIVVI
jgi:hypothetical protein